MNEITEDLHNLAISDPTKIVTLSFNRLEIGSLIKPAFTRVLIEFETLGGTFTRQNEYRGWIETIYIAPKFMGEAKLIYSVHKYLQRLIEDD